MFDSHGDIGASGGGPDGLFDCDTRYLSHLELMIDGTQPLLLGSAIKDDNLNYYVDLTNPDIYADGRIVLLKDTVHIARTIYLCDGSLRERIALTNHGATEVQLALSLAFSPAISPTCSRCAASVASCAARGGRRYWVRAVSACSYRGLDDAMRQTALSFEPAPSLLTESVATYALKLAPGVRQTIFVTASSRGRCPSPRSPSSRVWWRSIRASSPRPGALPASRPPTAC